LYLINISLRKLLLAHNISNRLSGISNRLSGISNRLSGFIVNSSIISLIMSFRFSDNIVQFDDLNIFSFDFYIQDLFILKLVLSQFSAIEQ